MNELVLRVQPVSGEAWHSYLVRVAARHGVRAATLGDHIGLRHRARWPGHHGVILHPRKAEDLAERLNLSAKAVYAMQLSAYDQRAFDLSGLITPEHIGIGGTRQTVHQAWVHLAGSRYCPTCLTAEGIWRLEWRLPWITTCSIHNTWLEHRCPACRGIPGLYNRRLHSSAPSRAGAPADGRICDLPTPTRVGICLFDLTTVPARPAPARAVQASDDFSDIIESGTGTVAGMRYSSLEVLRAWQATIGLAIAFGRVRVPTRTRNHRWGAPPRDAQLLQSLVESAHPVVQADDAAAAGETLKGWCREAGITAAHRDTFTRATRMNEPMRPIMRAALEGTGRAHIQIARRRQEGAAALEVLPWTVDDIPQLVWPCVLPPHRRSSTCPHERFLRCVIAMMCVRACTGQDWIDAGAMLGVPPTQARNWVRYACSARFPQLKNELLAAASNLEMRLHMQPRRATWRNRPVLPGCYGIAMLAEAQAPGCRAEDPSVTWCPCHSGESV